MVYVYVYILFATIYYYYYHYYKDLAYERTQVGLDTGIDPPQN